jgi:hypothetical protein
MPRRDIWDVEQSDPGAVIICGYDKNFQEQYKLGVQIGKGGFGRVLSCIHRSTGHVRPDCFPKLTAQAAV